MRRDAVAPKVNAQTSVSPRAQHATVERYLNALDARGSVANPEHLEAAIDQLSEQIEATSDLERLALVQKRIEAETLLMKILEESERLELLENEFVEVASDWAAAHGVTYQAFRRVGVPVAVLDRAAISRTVR